MTTETNAYQELLEYLLPNEEVEAIVFGPWGWGSAPSKLDEAWDPGHSEPDPTPVPFEWRGKILTLEQAKPMMESWCFRGGYGAPMCYATYVWTNQRMICVIQYDGSTWLNGMPRNPVATMPDMPGG